jgi:hypothetical protein
MDAVSLIMKKLMISHIQPPLFRFVREPFSHPLGSHGLIIGRLLFEEAVCEWEE